MLKTVWYPFGIDNIFLLHAGTHEWINDGEHFCDY